MKTITAASPSAIFLCGCRQLFAHHSKYNLLNTVAIETLSDVLDSFPTDVVVVDASSFTTEKGVFTEGGIFLEKIIKNHPKTKFLTLIRSDKTPLNPQITEGGNWLVPHTLTEAELLAVVERLCSGDCCDIVTLPVPSSFTAAEEPLTKREKQILDLIVNGLTSKKIAQELYISDRTVEVHRTNLCRKLHVANTASLVRMAVQMPLRT